MTRRRTGWASKKSIAAVSRRTKMQEAAALADGDHVWHLRFNVTCCKHCGVVMRADGTNKPCPGIVRVTLRAEAAPS
jgi:hypothetical protein